MLSNKVYDILKWIAQIVLPALGALYFGLSSIWGLPYGEEESAPLPSLTPFSGRCSASARRSITRRSRSDRRQRPP